MSKNLKSCPFCGCKDINLSFIFPDEEDEGWKIAYARECDQCHATTSWFTKEEEADDAWNRRADHDITPEQDIATTLGRGTCRLISAPQYGEGCQECSACGAVFDEYMFKSGRCPSCGAKVVDE